MLKSQYTLDNDWVKARERLTSIEQRRDPVTIAYMEQIGVAKGWHCLEVGAGGGSIAAWLCECVGPTGRIVATDINTRFLDALDYSNLKVLKHDLVADDLPSQSFDFVHARCVLIHLPQPQALLRKLFTSLKPGGWILIEDLDFIRNSADPLASKSSQDLFNKMTEALSLCQLEDGVDQYFGPKLFGLLRLVGFESVTGEGRRQLAQGGTADAQTHRLTFEQRRERLVSSGRATDAEVDAVLLLLDDPSFSWLGRLMISAWGRKPGV